MLKLLLPAIFCCCAFSGIAQGLQLKGKLIDAMDESTTLPYASIYLAGKNTGVFTDPEGNFLINAEEGDLIRFMYPGYETIELSAEEVIELKGLVALNVRQLREVVITAFKWEPYFLPHGPYGHGETTIQIGFFPDWKYFPNPTKDAVQVEIALAGRINVYTADQKLVMIQKITGEQTLVQLAGQAPGVYFLVFENDDFSKTIGQVVLTD
ncbi:MAG: carboxypeptidase-like regulatory domain-containing protein [Saprospiraceae bacterium]|nr:carboxypeptidase-like regulatory domain-containing protein [Saprospiraceae bacterium]